MTWTNTTHDWSETVDIEHLEAIRGDWRNFAPSGALHLLLEVIAYAADEAETRGGGQCQVTLHEDGWATVTDDGRGTDTRLDEHGRPVRKPVMSTKDLRFFDSPEPPSLPDGLPRRGISVVSALSEELVHVNRRRDGAWSQTYAHGMPVTDLTPVEPDGSTGTTVRFLPARQVAPTSAELGPDELGLLTKWPDLTVRIADLRGSNQS
ncbi:MAG: ATP-binding protein [Motilibacteraceae bacterium]